MGEIRPKTCEGRELTKNQLEEPAALEEAQLHPALRDIPRVTGELEAAHVLEILRVRHYYLRL